MQRRWTAPRLPGTALLPGPFPCCGVRCFVGFSRSLLDSLSPWIRAAASTDHLELAEKLRSVPRRGRLGSAWVSGNRHSELQAAGGATIPPRPCKGVALRIARTAAPAGACGAGAALPSRRPSNSCSGHEPIRVGARQHQAGAVPPAQAVARYAGPCALPPQFYHCAAPANSSPAATCFTPTRPCAAATRHVWRSRHAQRGVVDRRGRPGLLHDLAAGAAAAS